LAIVAALLKAFPGDFLWTDPPYEYVEDKLPVEVILGDPQVRKDLEQGRSILDLESTWKRDLHQFSEMRGRHFLYPR
jgi:uncharacterized protein YbbC (DUF1343 family)